MSKDTKATVAALRGSLADLTADDAAVAALQAIVRAQLTLLETTTTTIVAATSMIALEPGNRRLVGFASDAIEAAHKGLGAIEQTDKALDTLLAPYSARYAEVAHSVKVAT